MTLKVNQILKKRYQFQEVYAKGRSYRTKAFVVYFLKENETRFGFTVSKKIGKAVVRNKARRRLKSLVFENLSKFPENVWFVFNATRKIKEVEYSDLSEQLTQFLGWYHEKTGSSDNSLL